MNFVEKWVQKFAKSASTTAAEAVKVEVKNAAINALPAVIGIGLLVIGLKTFKSSLTGVPSASRIPSLSSMSVVINNIFFDESAKGEFLSKLTKINL